MAPKQWIPIRNIIIYLEAKFCPNRRIFVSYFAAVAMETKKGGFKKLLDSFHQTS
jgi:hypothetical protein